MPSLLVLLLSAIVVFFILPRLSPYILGALALALFGLGVYQHYTMFPYEYSSSTILDAMKAYSPFILLGSMILGILVIMLWSFGISPPAVTSIIPIPANIAANIASTPANKVNNRPATPANNKGGVLDALGLGGNNQKNQANNKGNNGGVMGALGLGGNNPKKNRPTGFTTV